MAETESLLSTCCIPSKHECITSFSIGRPPPPPLRPPQQQTTCMYSKRSPKVI